MTCRIDYVNKSDMEQGLSLETRKEQAMVVAGATREEAYKAIVRGLTAKKMTVDKFGEEHFEEDTTNQLRSAEIISRMNGDMKTDVVVDNRVVNISIGKDDLVPLMKVVEDVRIQLEGLRSNGKQTGEIIDI